MTADVEPASEDVVALRAQHLLRAHEDSPRPLGRQDPRPANDTAPVTILG